MKKITLKDLTKPNAIRELKRPDWERRIRELDCRNADLSDGDLHRRDFQGLNFTGCNLENCNFEDCDLIGANFTNANLKGVSFWGAMLSRAIFKDAAVDGNTDFKEAWVDGITGLQSAKVKNWESTDDNPNNSKAPKYNRYKDYYQYQYPASDPDTPKPPDTQKTEQDTTKREPPLNQILYGPPGTGKTWDTVNRAVAIIDNKSDNKSLGELRKNHNAVKQRFDELKENRRIEMVTFHQNFAYEDFIEGIRPVLDDKNDDENENIRYELSDGVFKKIAERARENSQEKYVLIIDEINRGNIAKIFGELITLIEESKRLRGDDATTVTLPYSKKDFGVPKNLYIIGTMNTADRSIALLDTALRRRFKFVEMMPDPKHDRISTDIDGVNCRELLVAMNKRIRFLLDREHQIGHTFFMDVEDMDSLAETFQTRIIPLLQEYFYDNWEKIDLVFKGNGFIQKIPIPEDLRNSNLIDDTRDFFYELLPVGDPEWKDPKSYQAIYEEKRGETDKTGQAT